MLFLAFIGAIVWSFYSNVTKRISGGHNGMVLFFIMTSIGLWILYFLVRQQRLLSIAKACCYYSLPLLRLVGRMHYGHLRLSRAMWLF